MQVIDFLFEEVVETGMETETKKFLDSEINKALAELVNDETANTVLYDLISDAEYESQKQGFYQGFECALKMFNDLKQFRKGCETTPK